MKDEVAQFFGPNFGTIRLKLKRKRNPKGYTMGEFLECIPWEQIEIRMGKRMFKNFLKWMSGQTCPIGGVYAYDLERYLEGYDNRD